MRKLVNDDEIGCNTLEICSLLKCTYVINILLYRSLKVD